VSVRCHEVILMKTTTTMMMMLMIMIFMTTMTEFGVRKTYVVLKFCLESCLASWKIHYLRPGVVQAAFFYDITRCKASRTSYFRLKISGKISRTCRIFEIW
jgi:hypothetical protein